MTTTIQSNSAQANAAQHLEERRQQALQLIQELKIERHEVWTMYCRVAELKPFSANRKIWNALTEFSQLLVDYISLGHFGIYNRLFVGDEKRGVVLALAQELYPELSKTTDAAIAFNDKYEKAGKALESNALQQDLSILGENLALRIDLEDKLCAMLLS